MVFAWVVSTVGCLVDAMVVKMDVSWAVLSALWLVVSKVDGWADVWAIHREGHIMRNGNEMRGVMIWGIMDDSWGHLGLYNKLARCKGYLSCGFS